MEILVHTVSHADMVVELTLIDEKGQYSTLGRPKFSLFQATSVKIQNVINTLVRNPKQQVSPSVAHVHERAMDQPNYAFKAHCSVTEFPVGFRLDSNPIPVEKIEDFRLKSNTNATEAILKHNKSPDNPKHGVFITAVYFPLLALLIPKWNLVLRQHESIRCERLLYIVSGAGIPRNTSHSAAGNSTEQTAKLMIFFAAQYYPQIRVAQVHSGSDIFRYDDNVTFVNQKLKPLLEQNRQSIVERCGDKWKQHFHVTIAYADGTPARLSALNASLRLYRPSYLHFWQMKTFWHEAKLSMDDVDFHSFENVEASPFIPVNDIEDELVKLLIVEMKQFRDQFTETAANERNELGQFWLRKTRKPVLSVLVVQKSPDQPPVLYRGVNCEVSMPTGSLCAERNVIGTALANDPTLHRRDIKIVGVLGINIRASMPGADKTQTPNRVNDLKRAAETETDTAGAKSRRPKRPRTFSCDDYTYTSSQTISIDVNPLAPCGACKEWLLKIAEANPALRVITFSNESCSDVYINQLM